MSVYLKLRDNSPSFLLESVEKGEQLGRYSFIGVQAPISLTARGRQVAIQGAGGAVLEVREAVDGRVPGRLGGRGTDVAERSSQLCFDSVIAIRGTKMSDDRLKS